MAFWKKIKKEKDAPGGGSSPAVSPVRAEAAEVKEREKEASVSSAPTRKIIGVLKGSHLTEKTAAGADRGVYGFRVSPGANKIRVREAVEREYAVVVSAVRMINTKEKARVRGRIVGWKPGFKKAIVTLKEGQKIEMQ